MLLMTLALMGAQEASTTQYRYDPLGRLIGVETTNGSRPPTTSEISYDKADNRTNYRVTGAENSTQFQAMVLPINGFTVIPFRP